MNLSKFLQLAQARAAPGRPVIDHGNLIGGEQLFAADLPAVQISALKSSCLPGKGCGRIFKRSISECVHRHVINRLILFNKGIIRIRQILRAVCRDAEKGKFIRFSKLFKPDLFCIFFHAQHLIKIPGISLNGKDLTYKGLEAADFLTDFFRKVLFRQILVIFEFFLRHGKIGDTHIIDFRIIRDGSVKFRIEHALHFGHFFR